MLLAMTSHKCLHKFDIALVNCHVYDIVKIIVIYYLIVDGLNAV